MNCAICGSKEYLVCFKEMMEFDDAWQGKEPIKHYFCLSCINARLRTELGKTYLEILSQVQKLDESKYETDQRAVALHLHLKEILKEYQGDDYTRKFLNEEWN